MATSSSIRRGLFLTLEGGEGAGKSTQIARLRLRLEDRGCKVVTTREPGGSPRAEGTRDILLSGRMKSGGTEAEAILFAAARLDHIETLIRPALFRGEAVLCDRFVDSTRVYQGVVQRADASLLGRLEAATTSDMMPDVTLVIDVPAEIGLERARLRRSARGEAADRFEAEGAAFHRLVRQAFLDIASAEPDRCVVVDGSGTPDEVAAAIWSAVEGRFANGAGEGRS